jgi:hypothetical protein
VHQICYLLAQVQKPGSDQGQVREILALVGRWRHIWDVNSGAPITVPASWMCTLYQLADTPARNSREPSWLLSSTQ